MVSDTVEARRDEAVAIFGFSARSPTTGTRSSTHPTSTSSSSQRPTCCTSRWSRRSRQRGQAGVLREAGRRHAGADRRRRARGRHAGVITGVGYNYRWAPLVQYAKQLIDNGELGDDHQLLRPVLLDVRQRSARACCRGGSSSTRPATASAPTSSATPSTSATTWSGGSPRSSAPARRSSSSARCRPGGGTHYDRGKPGDPTGEVTNEDYIGMMCAFAERGRGHVRSMPIDGRAGEPEQLRGLRHEGFGAWNLERMNELRVYIAARAQAHRVHHGVRRRPLPAARQLRSRHGPTASGSRT